MAATLALSASLVACSSSSGDDEAPAASTTTAGAGAAPSAPALGRPSPEVLDQVAALAGRLAIGDGGRLSLTGPDGTGEEVLTEAPGTVASQPTWSHDASHLAWSQVTPATIEVVVRDLATGDEETSELITTPAFYFQWSSDDQTLAFLRNDPNLAGLELGLVDPGAPPVRVGAAAPLFISWSPGAPVLAAHVAQQQVLVLPSPFVPAAEGLPEAAAVLNPSGLFAAPAWLDEATVLVASAQGLVRLDVTTQEETLVVDTGGGPVQFVLSPDRARVAFHQPSPPGGAVSPVAYTQAPVAGGGLQVIELGSGEVTEVTDMAPLAFEWSPDSQRLAWLEEGVSAIVPRARWNFWDGTTSTPSVSYEISGPVRDQYLPFFEQYAQSVTGWSSDSAAFAFAGRPDGRRDSNGIWVQLVGVPGAPPVRVAEGDIVAWSP